MKAQITKNWLKANCVEPEFLLWWKKKCKNLTMEETLKKAFKHKPRWALWLLAKFLKVPRRIKVSIFSAKEVSLLLEEKYFSNKRYKEYKKYKKNEAIKEIYNSPYLGDASYTATALNKAVSLIAHYYAEGITDSYQPGPTFYESALNKNLKEITAFVHTHKKGLQKKVFEYGLVLLKGQQELN